MAAFSQETIPPAPAGLKASVQVGDMEEREREGKKQGIEITCRVYLWPQRMCGVGSYYYGPFPGFLHWEDLTLCLSQSSASPLATYGELQRLEHSGLATLASLLFPDRSRGHPIWGT